MDFSSERDMLKLLFSRFRNDDRGASAILVAISLILLMGAAAVAIDLGAAWNERRQDQTASDLAAVSAGLSFALTQTNEATVTAALETARANLTAQYSGPNDPDWISAWRNCKDPDALSTTVDEPAAWNAIGTPNPGNELECISHDSTFLRVRVPVQQTDTSFGAVLGIDQIATEADTIVTFLDDGSGLLPFAIVGDASGGEICLDTSSQADPPCQNNDKGSFGAVLPPQWGKASLGTSQYCPSNGNGDGGLAAATAHGMDHYVLNYLSSNWYAYFGDPNAGYSNSAIFNSNVNVDVCTTTSGDRAAAADLSHEPDVEPINGVVVDTGNSARAEISRGLISGDTFGSSSSARLLKTTGADQVDVHDKHTKYLVDNTPLWHFLRTDLNYNNVDAPSSCAPGYVTGVPEGSAKSARMVECLEDYELGSGYDTLFKDEDKMVESPRFAVAPQLWMNDLGSGLSYSPVRETRPLYLAGIDLLKSKKNDWWYADFDDKGPICYNKNGDRETNTNKCESMEIDQVTAYLLPHGSYGDVVEKSYPGNNPDDIIPTIWE